MDLLLGAIFLTFSSPVMMMLLTKSDFSFNLNTFCFVFLVLWSWIPICTPVLLHLHNKGGFTLVFLVHHYGNLTIAFVLRLLFQVFLTWSIMLSFHFELQIVEVQLFFNCIFHFHCNSLFHFH